MCITTRRSKALCLNCGTSLERIAAESATRACSSLFTARYGSADPVEYYIGCQSDLHPVLFAPKELTVRGITILPGVKRHLPVDNGGNRHAALRTSALSAETPPAAEWPSLVYCANLDRDHWVLASACAGCATATNCFACSTPRPSGVGIEKRNGTSTRVPAIGASQTSASRSSTRYLIAARSGT